MFRKILNQKVNQRPDFRREKLSRWIDGVNSEFVRPVARHAFDERSSAKRVRHDETGLQNNSLVGKRDSETRIAIIGSYERVSPDRLGSQGAFKLPFVFR